ncbi:sodium-coupled neutral amino acid symporter 1 [Petaurus breviceps papuanus]|uniref:sodium-coupled neutral amino acid symporter 1 n=1 Tax=Petaurus breviceps papuanus TaxID=3040969 RepID=UPI0036DD0DBA
MQSLLDILDLVERHSSKPESQKAVSNTENARETIALVVQDTNRLTVDGLLTQEAMTPGNEPAMPLAVENKETQEERDKEQIQGTSSLSMSVFNLSNSIVGSGILGLSYALANTGIVLFLFLFIVITGVTKYSINLLLRCSEKTGCLNFENMGEKVYGTKGKYVIFGTTFIQNMGAILLYLFIIKNELPGVIKVFMGKEDKFLAWYVDDRVLIILVTAIIIFPLCLMKNLEFLGYTSGFSLFCMIFFLIVIIQKKFELSCSVSYTKTLSNETEEMCTARYIVLNFESVYALPTIAFAYVCHQAILPIYRDLKNRSLEKMKIVTNISLLSMCVLYLMTAFFGYLTFYGEVQPSLLHTYSSESIIIVIVRLSVMTSITFTVPVLFLTSRESLAELLRKSHFNTGERTVIAMILLSIEVFIVIFIPTMKDVFGVLGTTTSTTLIFIIPTTLFLKVTSSDSEKKSERLWAFSFLALGLMFSAVSIPLVVYDWATSSSTSETN